jgi:hypothetical protein
MKAVLTQHEVLFVIVVFLGSAVVLAYMWHIAERDWQPEDFTIKQCLWLVIFQFAAVDYNGLAPKSDVGTLMGIVVITWGLIIISLLVNVIFNSVVLASYEGWALDWLAQYELCELERHAAAQVLKTWWRQKMAGKKGQVDDTQYNIRLVQQYKYLREVSFKVNTNSGEGASDPITEAQAKMKNDLQLLIAKLDQGTGTLGSPPEGQQEGSASMGDRTANISNRVQELENSIDAILTQTKEVYEKTTGRPAPEAP